MGLCEDNIASRDGEKQLYGLQLCKCDILKILFIIILEPIIYKDDIFSKNVSNDNNN